MLAQYGKPIRDIDTDELISIRPYSWLQKPEAVDE
uniref:Uncharacterized protein n=1 Tax=Dulem virus 42 TaxID=3145760 RepID=A0AAU8B8J4_9CAUD